MITNPPPTKRVPTNTTPLDRRSRELRRQIVHTLAAGNRGHVASAFSVVEILRVLYDSVLRFDAKNPTWPQRDRCILSKGHGCLALYAVLVDKGFFPAEELNKFCKPDGILGGHPEYGKVPGVEASTGSLGHGLPIGIGLALAARLRRRPAPTSGPLPLISAPGAPQRVFVVCGDGECDEGSVWEAALCAAKHRLSNLAVLIDYNKQQSYGTTWEVLDLDPLADKWRAFGFAVAEVDGHSENNLNWHHKNRASKEEIESLLAALETE